MKRPVLALMDSDRGYAVSFMEHVNRKNRTPFEVRAFTEPGRLKRFLLQHRAEILLVSETDYREEMSGWTEGKILLLSDRFEREGKSVFKYQSSSDVMRDALKLYGESPSDGGPGKLPEKVLKQRMKVAGVFSPVGRSLKTAFAMTLGQCLAARKPTALINLETCPAFDELLHRTFAGSLSEALFHVRSGGEGIAAKILPMMQTLGALDYLPPCDSPGELWETPPGIWESLIGLMASESPYEALVLDFGEVPLLHPGLLLLCDVLYVTERPDGVSQAKMRSFFGRPLDGGEEGLTIGERVRERVRRISLSEGSLPVPGDRWFESLPYSRLGSFAEECIERDKL